MVADAFSAETSEPVLITGIKSRFGKEEFFTVGASKDSTQNLFSGPIIILVNGYSASASEIVSGALQDWGRAKVMGQKTFGKGCGQKLVPFSDGSILLLTEFYYYLPSGRSVHKTGVIPDILDDSAVTSDDIGNPEKDAVLDKALKQLKEK